MVFPLSRHRCLALSPRCFPCFSRAFPFRSNVRLASSAAAVSATVPRSVSPVLRIRHQPLLIRGIGGRTRVHHRCLPAAATSVEYTAKYLAPYQKSSDDLHLCPRLIDAEAVHGDEQAFWTERRHFRCSGSRANFLPSWDRQAQALLTLTQRVRRVPAAAAFRLMTLALRMLLLPQIVSGAASPLLPVTSLSLQTLPLVEKALAAQKNTTSAPSEPNTKTLTEKGHEGDT